MILKVGISPNLGLANYKYEKRNSRLHWCFFSFENYDDHGLMTDLEIDI